MPHCPPLFATAPLNLFQDHLPYMTYCTQTENMIQFQPKTYQISTNWWMHSPLSPTFNLLTCMPLQYSLAYRYTPRRLPGLVRTTTATIFLWQHTTSTYQIHFRNTYSTLQHTQQEIYGNHHRQYPESTRVGPGLYQWLGQNTQPYWAICILNTLTKTVQFHDLTKQAYGLSLFLFFQASILPAIIHYLKQCRSSLLSQVCTWSDN